MGAGLSYAESAGCRLHGDLALVPGALGRLKEYCLARGLRPEAWTGLELATAEALNNAVEHGCAKHDAATVSFQWRWEGDSIEIEISDPGDYLPDQTVANLPEDPLADGGRGTFLMASLMDVVEHTRTGEGHTLRLVKKIGAPAWGAAQAAEMEATMDSMAEELGRTYEELSALFRFAEELAAAPGFADVSERSLRRLLTLVSCEHAYVRFLSPDNDALVRLQSAPQPVGGLPERLPVGRGCTETAALHQRKAFTVEKPGALPEGDPLRALPGGVFVCPVFFQSEVLGCLVITQRAGTRYFSAGDMGLVRFVADFLGIAYATSRLQEQRDAEQRALREVEIAADIQRSLLPRTFPAKGGYHTQGACQSARQVGGDYFDALAVGDDGILLVIADVMGKGVPAALLASVFRTAIHARPHLAHQPARLLTEVNRQISADLEQVGMFITAQAGWLSVRDHSLVLANAGHCPVLHFQRGQDAVAQYHGGGIPLGVTEDFVYEERACQLGPGDLLVLLTDGIYEVENPRHEMLGMDRVTARLREFWREGHAALPAQVLDFAGGWSAGLPAADDRTLLMLRRGE